jgi:hypothetical protein
MDPQPKARHQSLIMSVPRIVLIFVIWTAGFALWVLKANSERGRYSGQPPVFVWLNPWSSAEGPLWIVGFPAVATLCLTLLLLAFRAALPPWAKAYLPWTTPRLEPRPDRPKSQSRQAAIASRILIAVATAFLVLAALHLRPDRTYRRGALTWEGPLAPIAFYLACAGWLLSFLAIGFAAYSHSNCETRYNRSFIWVFVLGTCNLFGSCLWSVALHED